jgi:cbb3-type cytochrome oxidase subunit 1
VVKEADWHTSHVHRCTCLTVTTALLKAFGGGAGVGASLFAPSVVSLATDWTGFSRLRLSFSSSVSFDILAACSSGWEAPWKSLSLSLRTPLPALPPAMVEQFVLLALGVVSGTH